MGLYQITLKFADVLGYTAPGQQIFNIFVNDTLQKANFDIYGTVRARNVAYDVVIPVYANLTTGTVAIQVQQVQGGAQLQAVSLVVTGASSSNFTLLSNFGDLQSAINAACSSGTPLVFNKNITVTSTSTLCSGLSIQGNGFTISAAASSGTVNILSASGAAGTTQNTTVNVNADPTQTTAASVTVADSSGFSPGDYITIGGQITDFTNTYVQTAQVRTSAAGVITPWQPVLVHALTTDNAHTVIKFTPLQNITIDGLNFDGAGASGATDARGIYFTYVANSTVKHCKFKNFISAGMLFYFGHNITVDDVEFTSSGNVNESDFLSSFVSWSNHTNIRSINSTGFGPQWQYGVGLNIFGVFSTGALNRAMKLAGVGRSTFRGIQNSGTRDAATGVCLAVAWRSWNVDFDGVELQNCAAAYGSLWVQDCSSCTLKGVHIAGSAGSGLQFEAASGTALGAVNVVVSELVTPDPVVNNALASAGNSVKWATFYTTRTYSSVASIISPASSTWTSIPFDTNSYDVGPIHSTSTNNTRFTAPVAATYKVTASVFFQGAGAGNLRAVRVFYNGSAQLTYTQGAITATYSIVPLIANLTLAKGDYIEIQVFQDSGGTLPIVGASAFNTNVTLELVQ